MSNEDGARIVYVIEQDGYVKIGSTTSLKSRLASLQTGCAVPLRLVGTCTGGFKRERALQHEFGAWRRHGEWFKFPPDVMDTLMSRLTLAERPTAALRTVPLRDWQRTRNAAWDDRRRKMQRLTDDEALAKERAARYRRMPRSPSRATMSGYIRYKKNVAWRKMRATHLMTYPECRACGTRDEVVVHHIRYRGKRGESEQPGDLMTLCRFHHDDYHHRYKLDALVANSLAYVEEIAQQVLVAAGH